jgi:hypothetical protein
MLRWSIDVCPWLVRHCSVDIKVMTVVSRLFGGEGRPVGSDSDFAADHTTNYRVANLSASGIHVEVDHKQQQQ